MKISEHANYLLNEYGRLQFDYAAYYKPYGESLRNEARNNLEEYITELEEENDRLQCAWFEEDEMRIGEPTNSLLVRLEGLTHKFEQGLERIQEYEKEVDAQKEILIEAIKIRDARIAELEAEIDQLTAHDATERQDDKWIPVSESPPDNWESVLTIDISKSTRDMVTAFFNPETSRWSTHSACDLWVTHWMPSPEPPIVYGKVCEE